MSTSNATTQAWRIMQRGRMPDVIKIGTIPAPQPKAGEVQIRVSHAALNPVDYKLASLLPGFVQNLPRTPAADFAGTITSVGVGELPAWAKEGTRVYGQFTATNFRKGLGSLQQLITINTKYIQPTPDSLDDEHAAGISLVGLTALVMANKLKGGERVLVVGGTTAVGLLAADMARAKGASFICATASGKKCEVVKQRGVDDVVDYREVNAGLELALRYQDNKFDMIMDCVGDQGVHAESVAFLKPTGHYLNIGASGLTSNMGFFSPEFRSTMAWTIKSTVLPGFLGGIPVKFEQTGLDDNLMPDLGELVNSGKLHPIVDKVFSWEEAPQAYEYLIAGRALGKVVVKVSA